ncbi:hypothetical protein CF326_g6317 [Tilletia indica]|nr:hypothetical protein CF326_g6317 [Tilletia indica]
MSIMSSTPAMAPQGWTVSPVRLELAAKLSLYRQQSSSSGDPVQVRTEVIAEVRDVEPDTTQETALRATLGDYSPASELLEEEVKLIENMITHWSESNECSATISGAMSNAADGPYEDRITPTSYSDALPSHPRTASSSSPSESSPSKRPRLSDSYQPASSDSTRTQLNASSLGAQVTGPPTKKASEQFFATSELLFLLCSCLTIERIDLLALSKVSKKLRAVALQVLVHEFSIPLSRTREALVLLRGNPDLVESIRFLRIWDDDVGCGIACAGICNWRSLGGFLAIVERRSTWPLPQVDLTLNPADLTRLLQELSMVPPLLERLAALRVVTGRSDRSSAVWQSPPHPAVTPGRHQTIHALSSIASLICYAQDFTDSNVLRRLHLELWESSQDDDDAFLCSRWSKFTGRVAEYLTDLTFLFSHDFDANFGCEILLEACWRSLRRLEIVGVDKIDEDEDEDASRDLGEALKRFSQTDNQIEDLSLCLSCPQTSTMGWLEGTFPRLQKCSFILHRNDTPSLTSFLLRHPEIRELTLHGPQIDATLLQGRDAPFSALRVFGGSKEAANVLLQHGARLQHLQLDGLWHLLSPRLPAQLLTDKESAGRITCLDIQLSSWQVDRMLFQLQGLLGAGAFPSLIELLVSANESREKNSSDPVACLERVLEELTRMNLGTLKALRVRYSETKRLPSDEALEGIPFDFPPALAYLAFCPKNAETAQYYRILRAPPNSPADVTTTPGRKLPRLQRLPPSFRLKVNTEDGTWEAPGELRREHSLFDHSGDEPRLKML